MDCMQLRYLWSRYSTGKNGLKLVKAYVKQVQYMGQYMGTRVVLNKWTECIVKVHVKQIWIETGQIAYIENMETLKN